MEKTEKNIILSAKDVEIQFSLRGKMLKAIRRCSLDLYEGETLAIVGESGSGKSVFTKSFLGMLGKLQCQILESYKHKYLREVQFLLQFLQVLHQHPNSCIH